MAGAGGGVGDGAAIFPPIALLLSALDSTKLF
jgi:hypothetical protein